MYLVPNTDEDNAKRNQLWSNEIVSKIRPEG